MENLLSYEDIKTELEVDLKGKKGLESSRLIERFISRQQRIILSFISKHDYGGMAAVATKLNNECYRDIVKEALLEQIDYVIKTKMIDPTQISGIIGNSSGVTVLNRDDIDSFTIAPLAEDILLTEGLLYTGRR